MDSACPRRGFFPFEVISEINRKPQPAKTVLPNKHSMNTLVVLLAALNVLIWGHNVVMIAGIIASMLVNAF
jgi:hypothetical protein